MCSRNLKIKFIYYENPFFSKNNKKYEKTQNKIHIPKSVFPKRITIIQIPRSFKIHNFITMTEAPYGSCVVISILRTRFFPEVLTVLAISSKPFELLTRNFYTKQSSRSPSKNVNHRNLSKLFFNFKKIKNTEFRTVFGFFKHSFGHIF